MKSDLNFIKKISEINEIEFNEILDDDDTPFTQYSFLDSLEKSNSVSASNGWKPIHLLSLKDRKINGFMPLYLKDNSHGEFVFDHSWSYALSQAGRQYYPKLLTAIPFTPCETRKIICKENGDDFIQTTKDLMIKKNIETWHVLFPDLETSKILKKNKLIERSGYKFIWKNKNYESFEDYLKIFRSRQRKNIKNERKKIFNSGITFSIKEADSLKDQDWEIFFKFYKNTYEQRLQRPYLNQDFFKLIQENKNVLKPVIFFAHLNDKIIAGSLCFRDKNALYGRHWGSSFNIDSLHFECCYYQGIEYCINKGLKKFDPGVQGEHKIRRGFEPIKTNSYHLIINEDFRSAILDFCLREKREIDNYLEACKRYTPFNKDYKI